MQNAILLITESKQMGIIASDARCSVQCTMFHAAMIQYSPFGFIGIVIVCGSHMHVWGGIVSATTLYWQMVLCACACVV